MKKILSIVLTLAIVLGTVGVPAFAEEVEVTENVITTISSLDDLTAFREAVNSGYTYDGKTVTLTGDIDLGSVADWTPIGNGERSGSGYTGNAFKGTFDGENHTISNLTITSGTSSASIGLFGVVDGGTVKNLTLSNVSINASDNKNAGAAIGLMVNNAAADNITVSGSVSAADGVGGVVGRMTVSGTVSNCVNSANVTGAAAGGIVGKAYYTGTGVEMNITNCTNSGIITGTTTGGAGGIVGFSATNVSGCTNNGTITSTADGVNLGGIVGWQQMYGEISGNTNSGSVTSDYAVTTAGGIVGWANYQYKTDGTASEYPLCEVISVTGNTNNASIIAANSTLGSGGIVGGAYNAVSVTDNTNYAEKITGSSFAAGILGNYQNNENNGYSGDAKTLTVENNTTYTKEENITANCVNVVCYDNVFYSERDYTSNNTVITESPVAQIGNTKYSTLAKALEAASAMTGDVTVEIYDRVTLNQSLSESYSSITFIGKDTDAEIYLDVQGYITATGKTVAFEDLILSKAEGGFITNAGFMNVAFGVYDVNSVSYTNCTFTNGAYASSGDITFTECTFYHSWDKYGLWAYGDVNIFVYGCTFDDYRGIKMYAEGAAKTTNLTVKNTDFSALDSKPAIVLTYGESVTLEDNTYSSTGAFELDLDGSPNGTSVTSDIYPTCVNDNGACGVLVDGKIYTTVAEAAEVATEGSSVVLLHDSTETVEFTEGVILDKNGYTAENVTVVQLGLSGSGTEEDPYLINTLAELKWFRDSVNTYTSDGSNQYKGKYVKLTADIDLDGENWTPIGTNSVGDHMAFLGTFDGANHTIKNLYVNADGDHLGFFARVGSYAEDVTPTIKNITFENVDVSANVTDHWTTGHGDYVGGVIANAGGNSVVTNVNVKGDVYVIGCGYVGGIVGHGYPDITDCSVIANEGSYVHAGYWCAGGIIGYAGEGGTPIINCYVEGFDIWSAYGAAAAVAGLLQDGNTLTNVSAKDVEITSNSDYCMGYIAGNGEASTLTNITATNVTAMANGKEITSTDAVASVDGVNYFDLQSALKALTSGATLTLLDDVTITEAWDNRYTGAKITVPVTIDGNGKTIKLTNTVADGGNYHSAFRFQADATVRNLTVDMSEATTTNNRLRAISSSANLTVEGCNFIGNSNYTNCRAIIYGEGAGANVGNLEICITNSTFKDWKRGVVDNENAQDVKTVAVTGNTFTNAGVALSATDAITFTDNTVTGAYATITSYTESATLAVVATGNTLTANDEEAGTMNYIDVATDNVTAQEDFYIVVPEPTGTLSCAYTSATTYWGECGGNASESFGFKFYNDDTYMGYSNLNNVGGIIDGDVYVSWHIKLDAASNTDEYWDMAWEIAPTIDMQPNRVEQWVDGVKVAECAIQPNWSDSIFPVVAAVTDADGKILSYVNNTENATLADAFAVEGNVIELLRDVTIGTTTNIAKSVTINGNGYKIKQSADFTYNGSNAMIDIMSGAIVTFNDVTFDGFKEAAIMRAVSANVVIDSCVITNCEQTVAQGLLRLAYGNATITNSQFVNNKCTMVVSFGFDGANDTDVLTIDGCLFEDNACAGTAVVYFADGDYGTVKNTKFVDNTVSTTGNAATLYMGWGDGFEVSGCTFEGNTVTTTGTSERIASAIFCDGCDVNENVFKNNTATKGDNTSAPTVAVAAYYGAADIGANYWNDGTEPVEGEDYTVEFTNQTVDNDSYYATLNEDGTLGDIVVTKKVAKVGDVEYTDLQVALNAAAAMSGDVTVEILDDIDLTNVDWTPVLVSGPGYPMVTVNGNNKTITGLNDMLFSGTWAGDSGLVINDLTIKDSDIVNDENDTQGTVGVGAFIGYPQASAVITLNNCHLVDSTVSGGHWTGGLIGIAGGYAGNDGPVFMNLTIKDCSVTGSTITGKGSVGAIIGHASCNTWTDVVIEDTAITGNTITSTGSSTNKAGIVMGTIGAAGTETTVNGTTLTGGVNVAVTESNNTATSNGTTITTVYGRQGTETGVLAITGGTYENYPIEEGVSYAAPAEGYEIVENEDGTYGIEEVATTISGTLSTCYANEYVEGESRITGELNVNATESVVVKLYSDETLLATTTLLKEEYFVYDGLTLKICIADDSSSWKTVWEDGMPRADYQPNKAVLYVDGQEMNTADVNMWNNDFYEGYEGQSWVWAELTGVNPAPVAAVAKIGDVEYSTLQSAIDAAAIGDTITVIADVADEAVNVDKALTITADAENKPVLSNVSISATGENVTSLTVSNLSFVGNSWINSGTADALTVSSVDANVTPVNTDYTNSRSAFISLGRSEQKELDLTVENCNIVTSGDRTNPILGWAAIKTATITGNTFGSEDAYQTNSDSVKFMSIAEGAVFNITGNTVYSNYNGFVFGQNTTRNNAYTVNVDANHFYGSADHVWIEVSGADTTHATIKATSNNTVNGEAFTVNDIKASSSINVWTSYAGVDVVTDESGKIISGSFLNEVAEDLIAEGYETVDNGDGTYSVQEVIEKTVAITYFNLGLGNDLSMNFYVAKNTIEEDSYVLFTKEYADGAEPLTKKILVSDALDPGDYYKFTFDGLAAKEMGDNVSIVFYNSEDEAISDERVTTFKDLCMTTFEDDNDKLNTLLVDMLNYGAYTQEHFNYNVSDLANADLTEEQRAYGTDSFEYSERQTSSLNGKTVSLSLELENNIQLNLYFEGIKDGMYGTISYVPHDGTTEVVKNVTYSDFVKNGSYYKLSADNLVVADYQQLVTFTIYNSDGSVYEVAKARMEDYGIGESDTLSDKIMIFAKSAYNHLHR
ncbi:MAG: right-handed parallel beta-helix repeat-containing protein [Clostridia bacterium]|nr:right-handed parallel beta-helix repeat-containing protein [Clostridia bacterium]